MGSKPHRFIMFPKNGAVENGWAEKLGRMAAESPATGFRRAGEIGHRF